MSANITHHERIFEWDFLPTEFELPFKIDNYPLWDETIDDPCPIPEDEHVGNWDDAENGCTHECFWWFLLDANGREVLRTPSEETAIELRNLLNSVLVSRWTLAGEPLTSGGDA